MMTGLNRNVPLQALILMGVSWPGMPCIGIKLAGNSLVHYLAAPAASAGLERQLRRSGQLSRNPIS